MDKPSLRHCFLQKLMKKKGPDSDLCFPDSKGEEEKVKNRCKVMS